MGGLMRRLLFRGMISFGDSSELGEVDELS